MILGTFYIYIYIYILRLLNCLHPPMGPWMIHVIIRGPRGHVRRRRPSSSSVRPSVRSSVRPSVVVKSVKSQSVYNHAQKMRKTK